ncbi:MAG: hypothetical protein KGJ23_00320 [Euryarchaeota archaeon]|nr:hypothetical protein [Euryarchaeota archaeon]MDE1835040.1 hypothetical protein [Euryarchaeota archaeon]MDE1879311.1 hypothetical protein [Euryarchaeota archaeon]MDE2044879.1 hypothetical protein [Thermoplasmata archaeon]
MVFEKFENWNFEAPAPAEVFPQAWNFWSQRGYQLQSTGPTSFRGRSFQSKLGIHRVADLTIASSGSGTSVQVHFRADVRADVAAGGVVVAVLLLPVAVVGAAISWHEYEKDWSQERSAFWDFLVHAAGARPAAGMVPPPPPSSPLFASSPSAPAPPPSVAGPPASTPVSAGVPAPSPVPSVTPPVRSCPACGAPASGEGKFCASCAAPMVRA